MPGLSDTRPDAERELIEVHRRMAPEQRLQRLSRLFADARVMHAAGMRLRRPQATADEIHRSWLARHGVPVEFRGEPLVDRDALTDLREVIAVLNRLGLSYALGGAFASSFYGIDRYTRDADLTVAPFPGKEAAFAEAFGPRYYLSLPAVEEPVRQRTTFNVINTSTGFKIDLFVRKDDPFEQSAMSRRRPVPLPDDPEQPIVLHAPEDVILFKLRWYRLGGESSDQQWQDVRGVLQVQAGRLDEAYLDHWARELGVFDLLVRARQIL